MAPGEAPDAVVFLECGLCPQHHAAYAAKLPRTRVVEFGERERTVEESMLGDRLEACVRPADGI